MTNSDASFGDLGVPEDLVAVLDKRGITTPFEIQRASIPDALAGRDVLGRAPTGSGKTLAFGIPMVAGIGKATPRRPRGLILSPTRELAEQIRRELEPLAKTRQRSVLAVYGGVGMESQRRALRKGLDLLVACPGRLLDLIGQGECSLDQVSFVVIDEADRMADMGFLPVVRQILDMCSSRQQTVMFSATLGKEVKVLTDTYQNAPVTHQVGASEPDLRLVAHRFILTEQSAKVGLSADIIDDAGPTIMFCRTRHGVDRVARQLKRVGVKAGWIHGGRSQNQRDAALKAFTDGRVQALVATDVAARGIHVDGVACVIHYDPPADPKDYVHRSGRTARAGAEGVVVSYINPDQKKGAIRMLKDVGLPPIPFEELPDISRREVKVVAGDRSKATKRRSGGTDRSKSRPESKPAQHNQHDPKGRGSMHSKRRSNQADAKGRDSTNGVRSEGKRERPRSAVDGAETKKTKRSGRSRPKNKQGSTKQGSTKQGSKARSGLSPGRKKRQRRARRGGSR